MPPPSPPDGPYDLVAILCWAAPARASLIGQEFTASYALPDVDSPFGGIVWTPAATFTVGAGVDTIGLLEGVATLTTDFSASSLAIDVTATLTSPTWSLATFNGPVFTSTAPHGILSAVVNPATTMVGFDDSRVTITAHQVHINWQGLQYDPTGDRVQVDFTFASVPEPASLTLVGLCMVGLLVRRKMTTH